MKVLAEKSDIGLWVGVVCSENDDDPDTGKIVARHKTMMELSDELVARREELEKRYPGKLVVMEKVPDPQRRVITAYF